MALTFRLVTLGSSPLQQEDAIGTERLIAIDQFEVEDCQFVGPALIAASVPGARVHSWTLSAGREPREVQLLVIRVKDHPAGSVELPGFVLQRC